MRGNHVRRRLKAGEPSIGTWLSLPSPEAAEYCSQLGFDWLTIDAEHNPIDIRTLAQMFAANPEGSAMSGNLLPVPFVEALDVTNVVVFLAGEKARYITGVALPVDAGFAVM